jgi:SAM-dependent methyltransferase
MAPSAKRRVFFSRLLRLLYFAPEYCLYRALRRTYPGTCYMTVDYAPWHGERVEDARALTFGDGSFDVILCSHVLEHIEEDRQAMGEMFRVLRAGGVALICVPIYPLDRAVTEEDFTIRDPGLRLKHYGALDHVRNYGLDVRDRLAGAGFRVEHLRSGDVVPEEEWDRERINDEHFFVATRPG